MTGTSSASFSSRARDLVASIEFWLPVADLCFTSAGDVEHIGAGISIAPKNSQPLGEIIATFGVLHRGDADDERHFWRHDTLDCLDDLLAEERKILPVLVCSVIDDRRVELMNEIAVGTVKLNRVDAGFDRKACGFLEFSNHSLYFFRA